MPFFQAKNLTFLHAVELLLSPTISYKKGIKENCDDIVGKSVDDF